MNLRAFTSVTDRRKALELEIGVSLPHIGTFSVDESQASTRNCENMIGVAQIPLGVAGPLKLQVARDKRQETSGKWQAASGKLQAASSNVEKECYIPLATTEGALIASVSRGCKVVGVAGGASVIVDRIGTTRGPVFQTSSLAHSYQLKLWIEQHLELLNTTAQQTSAHISLQSTFVQIQGTLVFARLAFDTEEAMGMNMVTIASEAIGQLIVKETGATFLAVSGNFCVDKKPSWQNSILGRGYRAWSEVVLPTTVITEHLKTTPEAYLRTWEAKCLIGSALSGSLGFNGHAANIIAALYLATGQDIAHVVEGSTAMTTMESVSDGVRVSVSLPSVMVGTVGGGTGLATQQEALALLGLKEKSDGQQSEQLAGIVAGAVLAGEISELAALSSHTLACAHQKLGRGGNA